jgi:ribosomal protein S18 acetylase RimI-like enzyme
VHIREAIAVDRAEVVRLWEVSGLTRPWNDPHVDFDRATTGATSAVLLAVEEDGAVGTVMVGHDGHRGWVYYLAVEPTLRGRGLGRQLMRSAETWLRDAGAVKVQLMVRSGNHDVLGFYAGLGFEPSDVTVMARWLAADPEPRPPGKIFG